MTDCEGMLGALQKVLRDQKIGREGITSDPN